MDLIQKACNLGFILKNKEYYLWELQRWLREEHKLSIEVYYFKGWDYDICFMETNTNTQGKVDLQTYEEALEQGLLEALKLIK